MTTYTVARKLPSMDSYTVTNASGAHVLEAKHHTGLNKEHWDVTDAEGHNVAAITHERFHTHATYRIDLPGQPQLTLTKTNWLPVSETWTLTGGSGDLTVTGDLADYMWQLTDPSGTVLATMQRKIVSLHHQYAIGVEGDPVMAVAVALTIDNEAADRDK